MYVVPLGTLVIARMGKIVITEGPQLGKFVIVDRCAGRVSNAINVMYRSFATRAGHSLA